MFISEVKNGVITPMFSIADVPKMIMERKRFFWPNSNFYGIKGIELQIGEFEYTMTKDSDVGNVYRLFKKAMDMDNLFMMRILRVK